MDVLALLDSLDAGTPVAIMMRHAERPAIIANDGYRMTGLTPRGMDDALGFGISLSRHFEGFRHFYSPVLRCRQTAEMIHQGLVKSGKPSEIAGAEDLLGIRYMLVDMDTGFGISDVLGNAFIRTWFDGGLEPGQFMPLEEARDMLAGFVRDKIMTSPGLDIHVTHDWNLNVLREGIFGMRHEDVGWPGFLSGMVFTLENGDLRAHVRDRNGNNVSAAIPL